MTWATRITVIRLLLVPVFVGLLLYYDASIRANAPDERLRLAAFAVFAIASVSDAIDGFLARHFNQQSALGAILDPIADKLLLVSALVTLSLIRFDTEIPFPLWFPILIITRDAILAIGLLVIRYQGLKVEIHPHWSGKTGTVLSILAIGLALLRGPLVWWLCLAAGFFTLVAMSVYFREGIRVLNQPSPAEKLV
jgi:cardiolipin synthase (CMP-forming)